MGKTIPTAIRKFDQSFYDVVGQFDERKYLYPTNFDEEKERFFQAVSHRQSYNPCFTYNNPSEKEFIMIEALQSMSMPEEPFGKLYQQIKQRILLTLEMVQNRQAQSFTNLSQKRFGIASSELVQDAQTILHKYRRQPIDNAYFGIKAVIDELREKLVSSQISHWNIEETQGYIWLCEADTINHKLLLPSGLLINQAWIQKIIQNVIEVIIYQNQNAQTQPLKIFLLGLDRYEETQKGLMIELAHRMGHIDSQSMRRHAGGVLASYLGHQYSFWETYQRLSNLFSQETAFTLAGLSKMGLCDTEEKGGLLHTHLALQGWKKVQNMTKGQLSHLYCGHVGMDQLEQIETWIEEGKIASPQWLPHILQSR